MTDILKKLKEVLAEDKIKTDEPMKDHTSFKIGGPADYYLKPDTEDVGPLVRFLEEVKLPFIILGNGSNCLFRDGGYRGAIISTENMDRVEISDGSVISAGAGVKLGNLCREAANASLTGLEFAAGIPGTVGGAVFMNAGAYGGEICKVLTEVTFLDEKRNLKTLKTEDLDMSYRHSIFSDHPEYVILSARLCLKPGNKEEIIACQTELLQKRREKQPLEYPSAGSTFKRPEGYFAGKLIQDAGLMGYRIGDAAVSDKHAGFLVNMGNATGSDMLSLISHVTDRVKETSGVTLMPEVRILGDD